MKYITKDILVSCDNDDFGAEEKIQSAFGLYLKEKVPALKKSEYAHRYLNLLDFHFHDCQILKISYDEENQKVILAFDGGLKPYGEHEKSDKRNIRQIEFSQSYVVSEIKIPFLFNLAKKNYLYIYANEFDFDTSTLYSKLSFICDTRDEVQIFFHSLEVW